MADKVHCIRKTLRLMPQEAKVLSDKAKANGMNEAEYIRLLISQKPNDYPEVRKILKELIWFLTDKKTDILSLIHSIITCLFCKHLGFLWH